MTEDPFQDIRERISHIQSHVDELRDKVSDLGERVSRLESDVSWLKDSFRSLEKRLMSIDKRSWGILSGVILTIVITILARLI